jgi:hypothetical protein
MRYVSTAPEISLVLNLSRYFVRVIVPLPHNGKPLHLIHAYFGDIRIEHLVVLAYIDVLPGTRYFTRLWSFALAVSLVDVRQTGHCRRSTHG